MGTTTDNPTADDMPVHQFLSQARRRLPHLTNDEVARALHYSKPNVVAMIFRGKMPLPIEKVPAIARVLQLDEFGLLRLALKEYRPKEWLTIESVIAVDRLVTRNELALLGHVRRAARGPDLPLMEDARFVGQLAACLTQARDRFDGAALVGRGRAGGPVSPDTVAQMMQLIERQAAERTGLWLRLGGEPGVFG